MKTYLFFLFVALILLAAGPSQAQYSGQQATDLVLNQLLDGELDRVDVFMIDHVKSNQSSILLRNNETIDMPYSSNWVYFVDDKPFANWAHSCRYIFVDEATGTHQVVNKNFFPADWKSAYAIVSEMPRPNPVDLPVIPNATIDGLPPNPHLYAVIISGDDEERFWNDISAMYCTLIDKYGFMKDNIFVHYANGHSTQPFGDDLDGGDPSNDIDYDAEKGTILHTFSEMANESNTSEEIPELQPNDVLFIFVDGHGYMSGGHSYIILPTPDLKDKVMAEALEGINCAQIIAVFQPCEIGGFKTELSDYINYEVSCKNRIIQTASNDELSWSEVHITGQKYNEFIYYWIAAVRGKYPHDDFPWEDSYEVGYLPVEIYFPVSPDPYAHPGDFIPDEHDDGFVQMEEAFVYANSMDTWSDDGYYYYPADPYEVPEEPQEAYTMGCQNMTILSGLAGHVDNQYLLSGRSYVVSADLITDNDWLEIEDNVTIYIQNTDTKIQVDEGGDLDINDNVSFHNNTINVDGEIDVGSMVMDWIS